jgi:hypothetical protein
MPTVQPYAVIAHRQAAFSGAYIRAVCAVAGCAVAVPEPDIDKLDFTVHSRVVGSLLSKPQINIQAKCERSGLATKAPIPYALDLETYDNLRDPLVVSPRILVLVLVPEHESEWLAQSEKELIMSHCGYWLSLKGLPASKNETSQTVYLPRTNIFTPAVLQEMMMKTGDGVDL